MSQLTLDNLLDENQPIYVRNMTNPRGIIVIALMSSSGRSDKEIIPNTKLPIRLSDRLPRDMIRHSKDLLELIFNKTLILVDPKEAENELRDPEKMEELLAAYRDAGCRNAEAVRYTNPNDNLKSLPETIPSHTQGDAVVAGEIDLDRFQKNREIEEQKLRNPQQPIIQPKVKGIVMALSASPPEMKMRDAKFQLAKMDLKEEDLRYIIDNTVASGIVNKYAKEQLAELIGEPFVDEDSSDENQEETDV